MSEVYINVKEQISKIVEIEKETSKSVMASLFGKYALLETGDIKKIKSVCSHYCYEDFDLRVEFEDDINEYNLYTASELVKGALYDMDGNKRIRIFTSKKEAEKAKNEFLQNGGVYGE